MQTLCHIYLEPWINFDTVCNQQCSSILSHSIFLISISYGLATNFEGKFAILVEKKFSKILIFFSNEIKVVCWNDQSDYTFTHML